jgi:hypothetical protein
MNKISFKRQVIVVIKALLCAISWSAFSYGCIAFFYWESNPQKWPWDGRYFMVFFGFLIGAAIGVFYSAISAENDKT